MLLDDSEVQSRLVADLEVQPPVTQAAASPPQSDLVRDADTQDQVESRCERSASACVCDHVLEIRNEAIRLASIACGRALRHAVMLHPRVIAAFVDDALGAAGNPQHARIRVHPDSVAAIAAPHHDRIGDDSLEPGDIFVESEGVTAGATLETRGMLLVKRAAEP